MRLPRVTSQAVVVYIAVVASVAAIIGVIVAYQTVEANKDRIDDIEQVNYDTCVARNELRTVLRTQIQRQISESIAFETSGTYDQFFPNIPAEDLHRLLAEQRNDLRDDKARLAAEECVIP